MYRRILNKIYIYFFLLYFFLAGELLFGQTTNQLHISRINDPINLDGLSNEKAWEGITPLSMIMFMPHFGNAPSERTEVMVAYDDDFLYVAGRLYDREPAKIQSNSKQQDSQDPSSEWFGIVIDSFNDKENALSFFTTPSGLRWDAAVIDDAQPPTPFNLNRNTYWDVATAQNSEGWFAEMRIPFSSLRSPVTETGLKSLFIRWNYYNVKNRYG